MRLHITRTPDIVGANPYGMDPWNIDHSVYVGANPYGPGFFAYTPMQVMLSVKRVRVHEGTISRINHQGGDNG